MRVVRDDLYGEMWGDVGTCTCTCHAHVGHVHAHAHAHAHVVHAHAHVMWGDVRRCGEVARCVLCEMACMGRCGEMWGDVGRCKEMWGGREVRVV